MVNFIALSTMQVLYIVIGILALCLIVTLTILIEKLRKHEDPRKDVKVEQPNFEEPKLNKQNELYITIPRNVTYSAGEKNQIKCGSYILRNASSEKTSMLIRYNGIVKEYTNETKITMGEGDSICCVSDSLVIIADL